MHQQHAVCGQDGYLLTQIAPWNGVMHCVSNMLPAMELCCATQMQLLLSCPTCTNANDSQNATLRDISLHMSVR